MFRGLLLCAVALVSLPAAARAEVLSFTSTVVADYEFSILGGDFTPFRAIGDLTFELDASLNDPSMPTTVPFVNVTGLLQGIPPSPAGFLPHTISPNVQFVGGSLTNIVRDAGGEVISADISGLSMRWEMIAMSPAFTGRLYTQEGLPFDASNVTIPFSVGTVLAGAAPFNVYFDDGDGDPTNDLPIVVGRNRTLTVVPEPASLSLLASAAASAAGYAGWRRRKPKATA